MGKHDVIRDSNITVRIYHLHADIAIHRSDNNLVKNK